MSYNVLIVDDSPIIRTIVKKAIAMSGVETGGIFEAGNGREALDTLAREWVDLVIADIHMPEMDGIEMVERMAADNLMGSVPVVIVSTERASERIDALRAHGIRAYLPKPFRPEEFRDVVRGILGEAGAAGPVAGETSHAF